MTFVVIRVVYEGNVPASVTAPSKFEGPNARIDAAGYVRRMLNAGLIEKDPKKRVEYHVLPVGGSNIQPAMLRSVPTPAVVSIHNRATVPEIRMKR